MGLLKKIAGWIMNIFNITKKIVPETIKQRYYYDTYISKWLDMYKGEKKYVTFTNAEGKTRQRELRQTRICKTIASEFASLTFSEKVDIKIKDNETYNKYVQNVLEENDFRTNKLELLEKMFALGGAVDKLYGKDGKIIIDYVTADYFIPTEWNNRRIVSGIFLTQATKGDYIYSLVEKHTFRKMKEFDTYETIIEFKLYKTRKTDSTSEGGVEVDLSEMYPDLSPREIITGITQPVFAYCKPAIANNIDLSSPLGVSIYENARDTIEILDTCFDSWEREFKLGKKRIIVPAYAMKPHTLADGTKITYFDSNEDVFQGLGLDENDRNTIKDDTQELRVEEHVSTINTLLNVLCLQVGLSTGTLSFDANSGLKTATEVVSENSKTFRTKTKNEVNIEKNIKDLVTAIIEIGQAYGDLKPAEYEIEIKFDDSIIIDKETERQKDFADMTAGVMSKRRYLKKWSGLTDEEIEEELNELNKTGIEGFEEE